MRKTLLFGAALATSLMFSQRAEAQLADGSIAPDFTFNDLNGTTHNLYDYLDQGYTVFIDVSAAWCGPCWSYHNTHALRDLYEDHGPSGYPSVIAGTTDDVMVLFVEGQLTNTTAQLNGTQGSTGNAYADNTQGNWVTGTTYPILDLPNNAAGQAFMTGYNIGYFPTVYKICPNRTITEVGSQTATALYTSVSSCPAPASQPNDAALLDYLGETKSCSAVDLEVRLQNNGTSALTSCTITAMDGATTVATYNWTGNLATYGYEDVVIGTFTPTNTSHNLTFNITTSDASATNNSVSGTIGKANTGANNAVVVKVTCDRYGSETTWKIFNSSNVQVAAGGPYTDAASNGAYPQPDVNLNLPNDCYRVEVYDAYGDGFDSGYGNGNFQVQVNGSNVASVSSFPAGTEMADAFEIEAFVGVEESVDANAVNVYPNPVNGVAKVNMTLANSENVVVEIYNAVGQKVASVNYGDLAAGKHNLDVDFSSLEAGVYYVNVTSGTQVISKKVTCVK